MIYKEFLKSKEIKYIETGFNMSFKINPMLYPFQKDIVKWSLKKGRSAVFADCGLGKTPIQLEWSNHIFKKFNKSILIFAPLAVSKQTVREGKKFDVKVEIAECQEDIKNGIYITNYEKLHKFNLKNIQGIVLDESSILKSYTGKFRTEIINKTKDIPFKLCCTATPAPNDYMELGNHSEFLNIMTRVEMLSMFFVHDSGDTAKWRLKGYAEGEFWKWLSAWSIVLRKPSDLGYDDNDFILPKINYHEHIIKSNRLPSGNSLFIQEAKTLQDRQKARRETIIERTAFISDKINKDKSQWLIWCNLNNESAEIKSQIKDCIEVKGADSDEHKVNSMWGFSKGEIKKLVTKPKIAGFGMNWQSCNNMAFIGLSDSYEQFYQATRRCWRFGQKKEVNVHIIITEEEGQVMQNIKRKEKDAKKMYDNMVEHMKNLSIKEIKGTRRDEMKYKTDCIKTENYKLILGDSIEEIQKIKEVDYTIFSPPFAELYTYSNSIRDMGNSKNYNDFFNHFKFLAKELYRITKRGRLLSFHCMDIPAMKERDGYLGLKDFPSDLIRLFQDVGFIYHSKVTIWKNPLIEATRTKALGLMHKQLCKDSALCRQGIPDYLITMRKPGENQNMIKHDPGLTEFIGTDNPNDKEGLKYCHEIWRRYASPVWMDINQSNTLNKIEARDHKDDKHICPLQLDVIGRCIELWTNENETVCDPFAGIGSTGYQAIKMNRKFIGIELKESYFNCMIKNLKQSEANKPKLF